jgi:hypothetical protein
MLFTRDLTIPAGTPVGSPVTSELVMVKGSIQRIEAVFPDGPAGLVHVIVRDSLNQLMPVNPDEDINQDATTVVSYMDYEMQRPYVLTFQGWAPATRYDHTITFNVDLAPAAGQTVKDLLESLLGAAGGVLAGR